MDGISKNNKDQKEWDKYGFEIKILQDGTYVPVEKKDMEEKINKMRRDGIIVECSNSKKT